MPEEEKKEGSLKQSLRSIMQDVKKKGEYGSGKSSDFSSKCKQQI